MKAFSITCVGAFILSGCAQNPTVTHHSPAEVERLDITLRKEAFGGATFGAIGAYEFISGVATVKLDPNHPSNRVIKDLSLAAGPDGFVRYKTDVAILRPVEAAKASKALIVDIPNRGNKLALARLADGANQFDTAAQAGHGWLMRQGHTVAWIGWQGDVPLGKQGAVVGTLFPEAKLNSQTIRGTSLEEFVFDKAEPKSRARLTYPAAAAEMTNAKLTVAARVGGSSEVIPSANWRFVNESEIEIDRPAQHDAGAIFQLTYVAEKPAVMGVGLAALRDVTTFLKSPKSDAPGLAQPLADIAPKVTVAMGISQSGRFLRDFIWEGFNQSKDGRRVFDGAMPLIAGSRKSFANARWAQPGRYSRQHEDRYYQGDQFPFAYPVTTDPVTGAIDGIFARCAKTDTCPKVMHLDSNLEFWQARASLVVVDGAGKEIQQPDNVRLYLMASTQHGPAATPVKGICQAPSNPAQQAPLVRALMARLIDWAKDGRQPPESRYPTLSNGGLAAFDRASMGFPDLAPLGVKFPGVMNDLVAVDHSTTPPTVMKNKAYRTYLPKTDGDGHDLVGVRLPDVDVPLATYTGFGLRAVGFAPDQLCGLNGTYLPLSVTQQERQQKADPRPALAERYASKAAYLGKLEQSGQRRVSEGFMLEEDVPRFAARAAQHELVKRLPD